jgi:hypothetical protein
MLKWTKTAGLSCMTVFLAIPWLHGQQTLRTVDIRQQIAPIEEEQYDAARFTAWNTAGGELPLTVTVQSISPVSFAARNTAVAELVVRNTGTKDFLLPVSREMKLLHPDVNTDRRMLACIMKLTNEVSGEQTISTGVMTFSSSEDPSSTMVLRPRESLVFRYEASFRLAWETDAGKWKTASDKGEVLVGVECSQQTYVPFPNAAKAERKYSSVGSQPVRSANMVRISSRH